jgi:Fur family iron response transcriptional regulator
MVSALLEKHDIKASPQRLAVGEVVLFNDRHLTADQVFAAARRRFAWLSRATVYNTLNLFVRKGLLRSLSLGDGPAVYDPNVKAHHHFIDEATGRIHDVDWGALRVARVGTLPDLQVREYQVVLRGKVTKTRK